MGVATGDDEEFSPEIHIGSGGLIVRVDSDLEPELVTLNTADGTVHEFTTDLGGFEGGYDWGGRAEHHIDDGWYGPIERVEARRGNSAVTVDRDSNLDLEVTCSLWKTPDIRPSNFRIRYEHASKRYDPPAGDEPAYGSPGRVIQSIEDGSYQLRINFDNRQDCQPEADRGVVFDCTSVTVYPEEFVNGVEEIYHPQLTFADGTQERLGDGSDEPFVPPATFEGTGDNEGKVIEQLRIDNDPGGETMFGYTNPDVDDCETDGGADRTIDSPTVIDEPGEYELVADIDSEAQEFDGLYDDACLWIRSSDVTLVGNGHTLSGDGNGDGIKIGEPDERLKNVEVHDLRVENWSTGIAVGDLSEWDTEALLEDMTVSGNAGTGITLYWANGSELRNVTSNDNGGHGISFWEVSDLMFQSVTTAANGAHGLDLWDDVYESEFTDVTTTGNGRAGIRTGIGVRANAFTDLTVADNEGPGIRGSEGGANTYEDAVIEANEDAGVVLWSQYNEDLNAVTVRDNDGWQVDARDDSSVTATELGIGETTEIEASAEPIALDAVAREELPDLPDDVRAIGDGVEVEGIAESVGLTLEHETVDGDGDDVELWRHDGDDWTVVESTDVDGAITADPTEDGVYAPVVTVRDESNDDTDEEETDPDEEERGRGRGHEGGSGGRGRGHEGGSGGRGRGGGGGSGGRGRGHGGGRRRSRFERSGIRHRFRRN